MVEFIKRVNKMRVLGLMERKGRRRGKQQTTLQENTGIFHNVLWKRKVK